MRGCLQSTGLDVQMSITRGTACSSTFLDSVLFWCDVDRPSICGIRVDFSTAPRNRHVVRGKSKVRNQTLIATRTKYLVVYFGLGFAGIRVSAWRWVGSNCWFSRFMRVYLDQFGRRAGVVGVLAWCCYRIILVGIVWPGLLVGG